MVEARGASDRPFNRPLVQQNIYRRILPGIPLSSEIWICRKMKFERKNELGEGISRMEVDETQEEGEDRFCSEFSEDGAFLRDEFLQEEEEGIKQAR